LARAIGAVLVGAVVAATAACGAGTPTVRWDLRTGHATSAIPGWPAGSVAYEVDDVDLTILLPGDRSFDGRGVTARLQARDGRLSVISITYPPTTIDAGVPEARALARQWGLRTDQLEAWYRVVRENRQRGVADGDETFPVSMAGQPLSPQGPTVWGYVLDSFQPDKPFLLDLEFQWTS
jgi:hypothetical protein